MIAGLRSLTTVSYPAKNRMDKTEDRTTYKVVEAQTASESGWPSPSVHPDLSGDEIHDWYAGLDELASDMPAFASLD